MFSEYSKDNLKSYDLELFNAIKQESLRQEQHIELIASQNYTSPNVMAVQGSVLTNKYAEGYPGKRYYGGCEYVDITENLAIERVKKLFLANYANVQPHSGSQANSGVFQALLKPYDTFLGMDLSNGGHLTHGSKVNFSGKIYNAVSYGLDKDGDIDYKQVEELALTHKPKLIIAGFSAFSKIVDWKKFRVIADKVNAYLMVDMAHIAGLVAASIYPSPLPYADVVTSTTHKTLRGPRGGIILSNNKSLEKKLNSVIFPGTQGGPLMHIIAAKAIAFKEALEPSFIEYQKQVVKNAKTIASVLLERDFNLVSNGTENHLILVDLRNKNYSGKDAEQELGKANITVNKNTVPNDPKSPFITSGLRLGTPAITTRGFKENECKIIANLIADILDNLYCEKTINRAKEEILNLTSNFKVYKETNI